MTPYYLRDFPTPIASWWDGGDGGELSLRGSDGMPPAVGVDVGSAVVSYRPAAGKEAAEPIRDIAVEVLLRRNVEVGIRYVESWLRGIGAAGINNLMEDVATAEISRSQVRLSSGETADAAVVRRVIDEHLSRGARGGGSRGLRVFHAAGAPAAGLSGR
jgi:hypothetical protein